MRRCAVRQQLPQQRDPPWLDLAALDGFLHRASRFRVVAAVAESAFAEQRTQFHERGRDVLGVEVRQSEFLHARRIDDPAVRVDRVERRLRRGMTPCLQRRGDLADFRRGIGQQCVDQRRLAHARLPDQHAALPDKQRREFARMVARAGPDHGIAERGQWRQARLERRETGEVALVRDQDETAAGAFGGDRPAMDEFVVVRRIGRHDAEDLRDVGGDELLAMRIGAIAQRRARQDVGDHAFVVRREVDRDPVAARDGSRAAAQDAKQRRVRRRATTA